MKNESFERNEKLIRQKYREYLIPSVFTAAALSLASVVDSAIVGNLVGTEELGGIGACSPVIALINAFFLLFTIGGATKASIALGERNTEKANQCFSISILLGLAISAVFIVVMLVLAEPVSYLLAGRDEGLAAYVIQYYRPILFVFPALFMTIGMSQYMRIDGYPKTASYIALASNAVNLVLDYCLIRFAGFGLTGASLSTVLGYVAGIGLVIPYLFSKKRSFRFVNPFKNAFFPRMGEILSGGSSRFFLNISDFFKRSIMNLLVVFYLGVTTEITARMTPISEKKTSGR